MKTYHINKIITSLLLVLILVGCEGNLEPVTYNQLSPSNFPKNAEDVRTAVTGCYSKMGSYQIPNWQNRLIMNIATTDEFVCFWGHWSWEDYSKFLWNSSSDNVILSYTEYIQAHTICINTIDRISQVAMNEDLKKRYIAEIHGLMAMLSYTLYDFYGPVPLVTNTKITMDPNTTFLPKRQTKEWMIKYIEENVQKAVEGTPKIYAESDFGRVTQGTALMALLKLYMHEKMWDKANATADQITALGVYQLQDTYKSIFSIANEKNSEIIWALPRNVSDMFNQWLAHVLPSPYVSPQGIPVQKWGGYKVPWVMYDKFEEGKDQRLECLWRYINTKDGVLDLKASTEAWAKLGAIPVKYDEDPASTGLAHGNDYVVYRYAEVLLSKAEALNELNGLNQTSVDLVNEIRNRAGATPITIGMFTDKNDFNNYILDERFRELFCEGSRREDLIRHGKYIEKAIERGAVGISETHNLFPIPQIARNENPNITQNPGY
ncbi:RagB/SusD family nutrient uptake outer membrane protein [Halosquirtibacter xylanolyticus]|uniref:RagB/SusD family nutrient uptake outer membrane protein n=1 Tax=Halosquirtibacter xylanolyticus TaxID=3374599 RepID=UPI003748AC44|nr:RagB/SusD family nutrient uptake outer membrane protein [Prolixibacteraceae bacterium]